MDKIFNFQNIQILLLGNISTKIYFLNKLAMALKKKLEHLYYQHYICHNDVECIFYLILRWYSSGTQFTLSDYSFVYCIFISHLRN